MDKQDILKFHLLGKARIEKNVEELTLPFKKAEALLFYIALEGISSREKIAGLLWGGKGEREAAGNIRNAVYQLKKILPQNFCSCGRELSLCCFITDVEELCALPAECTLPTVIFEEPLKNFGLPSSPEFDEWLRYTKKDIKDKVVKYLKERSSIYTAGPESMKAETLSAILKLEPFDEDTLLLLMRCYISMKTPSKALSLYRTFCERLEEDGVAPDAHLRQSAQKLLADSDGNALHMNNFFYGRNCEINEIIGNASRYSGGMLFCCIHGEAGIGKTTLVNRAVKLLKDENVELFSTLPLPVGERFRYSSWNEFVRQITKKYNDRALSIGGDSIAILSRYFYDLPDNMQIRGAPLSPEREIFAVGHTLAMLVNRLCAGKRLMLIFEDLHWYDEHSLALLRIFIMKLRLPAIFFFTSRPEFSDTIIKFLYNIKIEFHHCLMDIPLPPFSKDETVSYCRYFLKEDILEKRNEDYFFDKSEGIPLLLAEMVRKVRDHAEADCSVALDKLIMSRFEELSVLQRDILSCLSVFGGPASAENIAAALSMPCENIYEPLSDLLCRDMIREIESDGRFFVDFSHENIKESVYRSLSGFKRIYLHKSIAKFLSAKYYPHIWKTELSATLCYHYKIAGEDVKLLEQRLEEIYFDLNLNHILFPLIEDGVLLECSMPFSNKIDTEEKFKAVTQVFERCGESAIGDARLLRRLKASYYAMYGCYLISWGEYTAGINATNLASRLAEQDDGLLEISLRCLENTGYQHLQTDNADALKKTAKEILHHAKKKGKDKHIGLALRFIGTAYMIERDYDTAITVFRESVKIFEKLECEKKFYTLNRLAPHCYIGEIHQWRGDDELAKKEFEYCTALCMERGLFSGQSHFQAHAADAALGLGDNALFHRHIKESTLSFESSRGGCCTPVLYSLKAIDDVWERDIASAVRSLKNADFLITSGRKSWRAVHEMSKAYVVKFSDIKHKRELLNHLKMPCEYYANNAASLYEELGAHKRADYIKRKFL